MLKSETDLGRAGTIQEVVAWDPPNKITWYHPKDTLGGKEFTHDHEIKTTMSITKLLERENVARR